MHKIDAISIPFYSFTSSNSLLEKVLQDLKDKNFVPELEPGNGSVLENYFYDELFDFFDESIKQVKKLYYKDEIEFPITTCWVNKFNVLQKLRLHNHSNSVICGIYYLTSHENNSPTVFNAPNPWTYNYSENVMNMTISKENTNMISGTIFPEAGTLVLFPASLFHYMKAMNQKNNRMTIAFNTFPSGIISNYKTNELFVRPKSLREQFGQPR